MLLAKSLYSCVDEHSVESSCQKEIYSRFGSYVFKHCEVSFKNSGSSLPSALNKMGETC